MRLAVVFAAAAASTLAADEARACGGFFCSTGPVDQSAERIIFEVNDDGSSTAIVEVKFNGDPGDFSWVIPVPEVPVVEVVPALVLDILDTRARPTIIAPPLSYDSCDEDSRPAGYSGYGCSDAAPAPQDRAGDFGPDGGAVAPEENGVDVVELPRVGPYDDVVVVSSDDPNALIDWLNDNGYVITDAMRPLVEEYVLEGQKFLAVKLAPDSGVQDIAPIKFTCPSASPTVPLRLTAIAAEPHMGVVVHVAAGTTYLPQNFRVATIDEDDVRVDLWGYRDNYDSLVALAVEREGGQAFVVERAGPSQPVRDAVAAVSPSNDDETAAQQYVVDLLQRRTVLTRLSTRLSARDMTDDPVFVAAETQADGVVDLSSRAPRDVCDPNVESEPACGFAYCGVGARCAVDGNGVEGCVCEAGFAARRTLARSAFNPVPTIVCQDVAEDRLQGDVRIADPCEGFSCGGGTCVAVNGFPTCTCPEGEAAFVDADRADGVDCRPFATEFDVDRVSALSTALPTTSACASSRSRAPFELLAVALLALVVRRRR